jgi:exopolysaccharide/PEP-CTERM locus tyrosine autokinase
MSLVEEALKKRRAAAAEVTAKPARPASRKPVEAATAMRPVLGDMARRKRFDRAALEAVGLLPPQSEARRVEHQFRTLKRPLISGAFSDSAAESREQDGLSRRAIMVSSALPGDGKTFTSLNLALSMAMERDHSVILVDGDVAKPHISKLFGAGDEPGLLDVLEQPSLGIASVVLPTDVPGLSLVPVGRPSEHATELLASASMQSVILDLLALDQNAIVIVDSPPILLTSEARVLASLFGQVVLVVRAGGTPKQAVLDAVKLIGERPSLNLVLNQALHVGDGSYYGYGSGYGYGETSERESPQ